MKNGGNAGKYFEMPYSKTPKTLARLNCDLMSGQISEFEAVKGVVENEVDWARFTGLFRGKLVRIDHCFIDDPSTLMGMRATGYIGRLLVCHATMVATHFAPNAYTGPVIATEMLETVTAQDPAFLAVISLPPYVRQNSPDSIRATFSVVD